jgi:hypothetical protein
MQLNPISNIGLVSGVEYFIHELEVKYKPVEFFLVFSPGKIGHSGVVNDKYYISKVKDPFSFFKLSQPPHWHTVYKNKELIFYLNNKRSFSWKENSSWQP